MSKITKNFHSVSREHVDFLLRLFCGIKEKIVPIDDFSGQKNCRALFRGALAIVDFVVEENLVIKEGEQKEVIVKDISVCALGGESVLSLIVILAK